MKHFHTKQAVSLAIVSLALSAVAGTASAAMIQSSITADRTAPEFDQSHALQRFDSTLYRPRDGAVTISGNADLSGIANGGALLVGLVDAGFYDNSDDPQYSTISGPFGEGAVTYQSGAYALFAPSGGTRSFGPTDGNDNAELVQNFGNLNGNTAVDFSLTINPDGTLAVTYAGQTVTDTYGDIKSRTDFGFGEAYSYDEFANGAYLSIELSSAGNGTGPQTVNYDLTATPGITADVPEPSSFALLSLGLIATVTLSMRRRRNG